MTIIKNNLINEMVSICEDYENDTFDFDHVSEWIDQFPNTYHIVILSNLVNILKKTYYSKEDIERKLVSCLNNKEIFPKGIDDYGFLNIQENGGSQRDLLNILINKNKHNHSINVVEYEEINSGDYIYLDDCFYSGNTLYRDIKRWVDEVDLNMINSLTIIYLGYHNRQHDYIVKQKILKELLPEKNIRVRSNIKFIDEDVNANQYDSFLPPDVDYSENTNEYIEKIIGKRTERANRYYPIVRNKDKDLIDTFFLSKNDRIVVESIFLEKGVEISQNVSNSNFRPMGYDSNNTLGFGSFFITYRNIANNCPLVLWWGDRTKEYLGTWKPLFTRNVNSGF